MGLSSKKRKVFRGKGLRGLCRGVWGGGCVEMGENGNRRFGVRCLGVRGYGDIGRGGLGEWLQVLVL